MSAISSRSDQLLESLQEHCHHLAAEVGRAERVLEEAKQAQEDLFHSFQSVSVFLLSFWFKRIYFFVAAVMVILLVPVVVALVVVVVVEVVVASTQYWSLTEYFRGGSIGPLLWFCTLISNSFLYINISSYPRRRRIQGRQSI